MMEYVRGGSLAQRFRAAALQGRRVPLRERCRIALQAALGMSYLHDQQPAVIHFDLKPDNLLVEGEGEDVLIKVGAAWLCTGVMPGVVADFGLSKHKFQTYVTCHDLRGTLPYMAPELVANPNKVCEKCDVWSMGVVMWEMLTLEVPFQELTAQQIIMGLMHGTLNLRTPRDCEPEWLSLIAQCMETSPVHRPAFRDLALRLENLGRSLDQQQQQYQQQLQAAAEAQAQALLLQQQMALHAQAQERERQAQIQHLQLQAAIQLQQQQQQQAVAAVAVATGLLPPPSPTLYHLGHHHHHHHDILTAQHQHQQQQQQLLNSVLRMANSPILYP
ncbi:kinase-like domain-containing protein [Haematococcus lacustris]